MTPEELGEFVTRVKLCLLIDWFFSSAKKCGERVGYDKNDPDGWGALDYIFMPPLPFVISQGLSLVN